MEKIDKNKLVLSTAIVLGCLIIGGFLFAIQVNKQNSIERQAQMKIEQENQANIKKQAEIDRQQQALIAKQEEETRIKKLCAVQLERNGNYLVSNETLNTNYNACLHSNGL